ncbi:anthranilate synthase component I [Coraliomargarita sinensis]|uniref:Anthranilate synthase component 1 n=1 Tax=Coraliomargarita sinensis TaxID=2174842 RepID=A0A317ZMN9_9BACT|nr:anthranilate synthase component I [Coraliomargarita sinensis]PXA05447.1 anthranilate synthase component I [Coraliomargarita sinensis]
MHIQPSRSDFEAFAAKGNTVPVYLDMTADCETPLGAYSKIRSEGPAFLFESIVGGERISRYSFLGANPRKVFRIYEDEVKITHKDGRTECCPTPEDPLKVIEAEMAQYQPVKTPGMPPFNGGAVGYVGHEYIHYVEPTIHKPAKNPLELPILYYMITDSVLIFDHAHQVLRICVNAKIDGDPGAAYDLACEEIHKICEQLETQQKLGHRELCEPGEVTVPPGNYTQPDFEAAVEKVKDYVRAGDVIQTVLSQRFEKPFEPTAVDLYRALRMVNPSPYMFLLEDGDFSVVGASPEVHVRLTGDEVEIRPIAGTRHRGANENEDLALEKDLLGDAKERAEHLMLVDLARNDIGRVCKYGSIHVPDYMVIERYSHVMHIVSQVGGTIRPDCTAYDLMRATFPAGTLSGAPKVRALQIISELEQSQRGVYGGAIGYFGFEGNHDSAIGIRTAVVKDGKIYIQSGAGVVADSEPESEYMETVNKAKAMLKAVATAEEMFKI